MGAEKKGQALGVKKGFLEKVTIGIKSRESLANSVTSQNLSSSSFW